MSFDSRMVLMTDVDLGDGHPEAFGDLALTLGLT